MGQPVLRLPDAAKSSKDNLILHSLNLILLLLFTSTADVQLYVIMKYKDSQEVLKKYKQKIILI